MKLTNLLLQFSVLSCKPRMIKFRRLNRGSGNNVVNPNNTVTENNVFERNRNRYWDRQSSGFVGLNDEINK